MDGLDLNTVAGLGVVSVFAWFVSTLAGGGSSLLSMPVIGFLLGTSAIAPTTTVGGLLGNVERVIAYRTKINWKIVLWEAPGAFFGGVTGAFVLTKIRVEWIGFFVAFFLIFSSAKYLLKGKRNRDEKHQEPIIKAWYFLPAGFLYAVLSGILGSMGSLLAPLYISYGLQKEELLVTQSITRALIHIVKIFAYAAFGLLLTPHIVYGLVIGLAALPGNWLGHMALEHVSEYRFRQFVMAFVLFSGLLILVQAYSSLA